LAKFVFIGGVETFIKINMEFSSNLHAPFDILQD